jgi:ATP-dependent exoDNAse (exonuclease V) beta subunit
MTQELPDAAIRREITGCLDRTLFVEAGAGSGKTQSLVNRVVATVLSTAQAVPLRHVAAVTFTEKAGAELRDRLRVAFESELGAAEPGSERADRAAEALDDLDAAAIGTLHSFAELDRVRAGVSQGRVRRGRGAGRRVARRCRGRGAAPTG